MCAKWAMEPPNIEYPVKPENKSKAINPGIKYFALIGTGTNSKNNSTFGNIIPKATNGIPDEALVYNHLFIFA